MDANCQRTGLLLVVIGNERQTGRNVEGFTDAHQGSQGIHLFKCGTEAHHQGDEGPDKEAADNEPFPVETVGNHAGYRTHETINPEKDGHQTTEVGSLFQFNNIDTHGIAHSRKHLPVHVVQEGHYPEQPYHNPGIIFVFFHDRDS